VAIDTNNSYSPSAVMNATVPGPMCVNGFPQWQGSTPAVFAATLALSSEDCLLLDVKVPAKPVSSSLPVMVQIHGGGATDLDSVPDKSDLTDPS
jgi:carboxylesterase type B